MSISLEGILLLFLFFRLPGYILFSPIFLMLQVSDSTVMRILRKEFLSEGRRGRSREVWARGAKKKASQKNVTYWDCSLAE